MNSTLARTISLAALLLLLPVTIWSHGQVKAPDWPTAVGHVIEVDLRRYFEQGSDTGRAPRSMIEIAATAEYEVDGVAFTRRLPTHEFVDDGERDLASVRASLIGCTIRVEYNPEKADEAPPVRWDWWIAWSLTLACGCCLLPWLHMAFTHLFQEFDKPQPRRRVISGSEYRQRHGNSV